ncbi:MAG: tRNA (adenosine(37)-N6)-threonylcarbamoyltransferase complex ATPase subunit type 1 TsaE, partial [Acidimicrobiales bacterium]
SRLSRSWGRQRLGTKSAEDTRELAAAIAALVEPGDVVLLVGDLGAGKTTFAQGFGAGLGVSEPITSPTFVLVRSYRGRLDLLHADVYRLDRLQEVVDLGLPELLDEGGVALVEWGDMAAPALAPDFLEVHLHQEGEDERTIDLRPVGRRWSARWPALGSALQRWQLP